MPLADGKSAAYCRPRKVNRGWGAISTVGRGVLSLPCRMMLGIVNSDVFVAIGLHLL